MILASIPTSGWAWPWWGTMVAINVVNFAVCWWIFYKSRQNSSLEPENAKYRKQTRIFGAIYCSVALYRSMFVSSYPERLVWFESMFNSPLVIRCIAIFAELSYGALLMVVLLQLMKEVPFDKKQMENKFMNFIATKSPYIIFSCLAIGQFFAYGGLFTQHLWMFAVEESMWALGFLSIAPLVLIQTKRVYSRKSPEDKSQLKLYRIFLMMLAIFTVGYLIYQFLFSLPFTYYTKIGADLLKPHTDLITGIKNALFDFNPTRDFERWGGIAFFIWHSGYFSICVWMVLFFMNGPRLINKGLQEKLK